MPIGHVALGALDLRARAPRARRAWLHGGPATTGPTSLASVQSAATRDRARADEAHLVARSCWRRRRRRPAADHRRARSGSAPRTPQAISRPTSIATPTERPTRCPRRPAPAKPKSHAGRARAERGSSPDDLARRRPRAPRARANAAEATAPQHDRAQALARFCRLVADLPRTARADLEHLGRGHAFGVGQVGVGDQRAAQRDRVHHAEDAAGGADQRTRSRTGSRSTSRHDQAGQHEDDRRTACRPPRPPSARCCSPGSGEPLKKRSTAIEITAAGIEVAKVRPTFRPR